MKNQEELRVPNAETEQEFLTNALAVWLGTQSKPVPSKMELSNKIFYYPSRGGDEILTAEDEGVYEDGE